MRMAGAEEIKPSGHSYPVFYLAPAQCLTVAMMIPSPEKKTKAFGVPPRFLPVCLLIAAMWLRCFTLTVFMVFTLSNDS